ncbi:MAG TPA: helix-turn-helix domain-containing protein, partial [Pseudonocardiaceae bacterium]|nr:helix-turn-helix domain-containing protein [Pseudonocardiaceae bacterium]
MTTHRDPPASPAGIDPIPAARQAFLLLRTVFTVAPVLFGLDKFFGLLTDWEGYLAPQIDGLVPGTAHQAMLVVGEDLHHADREHRLVGGAGDQPVDLRGEVALPVGEQPEELVQPEQHRRHRENGAQQQERLPSGRGGVDARRRCRGVAVGGHDFLQVLKDATMDVRTPSLLSQCSCLLESVDQLDDFVSQVSRVSALAEPARRALYLYVAAQPEAVSRDQAAEGVGLPRHTVKFHLDKLVADGLLDTEFRRLSGRRGPGAGRPTKLYRRSAREVAVTLPQRHYDLAGRILAGAVETAARDGVPVLEAVHR